MSPAGPRPAASPFLPRPGYPSPWVLRFWLALWLHSLFIGPLFFDSLSRPIGQSIVADLLASVVELQPPVQAPAHIHFRFCRGTLALPLKLVVVVLESYDPILAYRPLLLDR